MWIYPSPCALLSWAAASSGTTWTWLASSSSLPASRTWEDVASYRLRTVLRGKGCCGTTDAAAPAGYDLAVFRPIRLDRGSL